MAEMFYRRSEVDGRYQLTKHEYGKTSVKILHVDRSEEPLHKIREMKVDTRLQLRSISDYLTGDNKEVVATDTQKNTVYGLAKRHGVKQPENFALLLANHFLNKYPQIDRAHVKVEGRPWQRLVTPEGPHNHAFLSCPSEVHYCVIMQERLPNSGALGKPTVKSGLRGLRILKTTQSKFENFACAKSDEFCTLIDASDRVLCTEVKAEWEYEQSAITTTFDFEVVWRTVRSSILSHFAGPPHEGVTSLSVQHTLYQIQRAILLAVPQIVGVEVCMPNIHYLPLDLSRFFTGSKRGTEGPAVVYMPTEEPSGFISARLNRANLDGSHVSAKL